MLVLDSPNESLDPAMKRQMSDSLVAGGSGELQVYNEEEFHDYKPTIRPFVAVCIFNPISLGLSPLSDASESLSDLSDKKSNDEADTSQKKVSRIVDDNLTDSSFVVSETISPTKSGEIL